MQFLFLKLALQINFTKNLRCEFALLQNVLEEKMKKKLKKSQKNKMIAGVCGGISEYFNIDATIVRLIFVIVALFKGMGILFYLIAAVIIPSQEVDDIDIENMKTANFNENDDEKEESEKSKKSFRSDEEFNSYFKK